MPTYNYLCNSCGDEAEYFSVPANSHPLCANCGSDNMTRLPSAANIGGLELRSISAKDVCGKGIALELTPIKEKCPCGCGATGFQVKVSPFDCGPSKN